MKKALWFSSLLAVFAAISFATPPKDILTVDLNQNGSWSRNRTDVRPARQQ